MEILIFFTIMFYVGTFIYSDEALETDAARNNIFLTKLICNLVKCSQDGYDKALVYAVSSNNLEMVKFLLESEKCSQNGYDEALRTADSSNNLEMVKFLLESGKCSKDACDSALQSAARNNNLEMIKFLVKSRNFSIDGYKSTLDTAAMNNNLEMIKFLLELVKYSQGLYDWALGFAATYNNLEIVKYLARLGKCSEFGYDIALICAAKHNNNLEMVKFLLESGNFSQYCYKLVLEDVAENNNLEMVKYLVESEKCSDDAIKEALFNQDGTLKEEFNGIKNELIKKYKAQKEWHINKYVIIHNLNKLDNSCITFDQLNIIFKKIFNFEGLLSASLIKYLDVYSYLNLFNALIDSPKRKAIEEENGDKNSDNKNNEAKEEKEENGDKSTSKQYAPETVDEDFLMRVYGEYLSGKEFWEELKEILLANLSEIKKMMEINKLEIEISILEINHPAVILLSKESIEQEVTLPGLYITDSKGIGMGVTTTSQNLDNTQEIPTLNDETPHHYAQLL